MSAFTPIPPRSATEMFPSFGEVEGLKVIADLAEAGLIKAYARLSERIEPCGSRETVRDKRIPAEMWRRIIAEGKVPEVLSGTVRLDGSPEFGGGPKVSLIGIRFDPESLRRAADEHGANHVAAPSRANAAKPAKAKLPQPVEDTPVDSSNTPVTFPSPAPRCAAVPSDAALLKLDQAVVMLNVGRTKLHALINSGDLERVKIGKGSRITRESIERFLSRGGTSAG